MEEKKIKKLEEWQKMNFSEKRRFNGYNGFCEGRLFKDDNLFMKEYKDKLKRRLEKEKIWRNKKKNDK